MFGQKLCLLYSMFIDGRCFQYLHLRGLLQVATCDVLRVVGAAQNVSTNVYYENTFKFFLCKAHQFQMKQKRELHSIYYCFA